MLPALVPVPLCVHVCVCMHVCVFMCLFLHKTLFFFFFAVDHGQKVKNAGVDILLGFKGEG